MLSVTTTVADLSNLNIARAQTVHEGLSKVLKPCEWATYVIVSQPSVSSHDFLYETDSAPHLQRWSTNTTDTIRQSVIVSDVLGDMDWEQLAQEVKQECKATIEDVDASTGYLPIADSSPRVIKVSFPPPPSHRGQRKERLREQDSFLNALLTSVASEPTIVLYTTTPISGVLHDQHGSPHHELHLYDNEDPFHQGLHVDLKRNFAKRQEKGNASLPLFEKYQYFTPGIFTGMLVSLPLFLILYVGVSAVAGLDVSYYAFSKEMGPAAQKKQQQ